MDLKSVQLKLPRAIEKGNWEEVREMLEEAKSSDTLQEILSEDKLVLLMAVSNNAPIDVVTSLISPSNINMKDDDGDTVFHNAVREKRWDLVPVLLHHGADVNVGNILNQTQLYIAVYHDAPTEIITQLISSHNINMQEKEGDTALHVAMRKKRWELVQVLLQHGADVNVGNIWNQLYNAVHHDVPTDIITQLISAHSINMQGDDGYTVLHWAVKKKRWELVPILLEHGADVNLCDRKTQTTLHRAVLCGAPAVIITQLISHQYINVQNKYGNTVLHTVVEKKRWERVSVLLQHGADVNQSNGYEETPLHIAVSRGASADIITRLISPQNINMQNRDGKTVLYVALREKGWELVPVLLQHGADVNLSDDDFETPLHFAARCGAPADIITQLISPHNINMREKGDHRVLHWAVRAERWDLVPVLLQHGADVNLSNGWKQTPIHCAAYFGAPEDIITQLVSPQNIIMQDENGYTALYVAVRVKRWELVPVLLQHGADPFICGILPEPPRPLSLQFLCIATIRSHMPVKSDEMFGRLRLSQILLPELKLKPLANEIIAVKHRINMK